MAFQTQCIFLRKRIKKEETLIIETDLNKETIIVPNVDEFPRHIACISDSKSEIAVCSIKNSTVQFVLDVDSNKLNDFDEIDKRYLEELMASL